MHRLCFMSTLIPLRLRAGTFPDSVSTSIDKCLFSSLSVCPRFDCFLEVDVCFFYAYDHNHSVGLCMYARLAVIPTSV